MVEMHVFVATVRADTYRAVVHSNGRYVQTPAARRRPRSASVRAEDLFQHCAQVSVVAALRVCVGGKPRTSRLRTRKSSRCAANGLAVLHIPRCLRIRERRGCPASPGGVHDSLVQLRVDVFRPVTVDATMTRTAAIAIATIQRTQSMPALPSPPKAV